MLGRDRIELKTPDQVRRMRQAGLVVADVHAALREAVRPGITTAEERQKSFTDMMKVALGAEY